MSAVGGLVSIGGVDGGQLGGSVGAIAGKRPFAEPPPDPLRGRQSVSTRQALDRAELDVIEQHL